MSVTYIALRCDQHHGLERFLRSTKSQAARHERKFQSDGVRDAGVSKGSSVKWLHVLKICGRSIRDQMYQSISFDAEEQAPRLVK